MSLYQGDKALSQSYKHANKHASGGSDPITPESIGAAPAPFKPAGKSYLTETGHTGNGYARITAISIESFNGYVKVSSDTWKKISGIYVKNELWAKASSLHCKIEASRWERN